MFLQHHQPLRPKRRSFLSSCCYSPGPAPHSDPSVSAVNKMPRDTRYFMKHSSSILVAPLSRLYLAYLVSQRGTLRLPPLPSMMNVPTLPHLHAALHRKNTELKETEKKKKSLRFQKNKPKKRNIFWFSKRKICSAFQTGNAAETTLLELYVFRNWGIKELANKNRTHC